MRREPVLLRDTCNRSALCARLVYLLAVLPAVLLPSTNLKPKPKPKHRRIQAQLPGVRDTRTIGIGNQCASEAQGDSGRRRDGPSCPLKMEPELCPDEILY